MANLGDDDEPIPQLLCSIQEVNCYGIPPLRPGTTGHRSGEWLVGSKIFTGRLKVMSTGLKLEVHLEDPNTKQLFAACPIPRGMRSVCVESCVDSSRNFVIRLEDAETKRHAFVGLGFGTREESCDFTEALLRHEKLAEREIAASKMGAAEQQQPLQQQQRGASPASPSSGSVLQKTANQEMEALYAPRQERSLGSQTIRVNLPNASKRTEGATLASGCLGVTGTTPSGLVKLAPPPAPAPINPPAPFRPMFDPFAELAGSGSGPLPVEPIPQPAAPVTQPQPQPPASSDYGWATFV